MRAGRRRREEEAARQQAKDDACVGGGCKCYCHEPDPPEDPVKIKRDQRIGTIVLLIAILALFGGIGLLIYDAKRRTADYRACFQTIEVDGRLCRLVPICRVGPVRRCDEIVTCNFTGPADGGNCHE